jgi:ABC-type lipoprotein release transport system permease subunit
VNPLSPFTYYRRHKRRAFLLTALLALSITGLYLLVGLMYETYVTPAHSINRYLSKFSLVQPSGANALEPAVAARIRAHPDVARVLDQNNVEILVPNVGGLSFEFRLLGLQQADVAEVLANSGVKLDSGQTPQPGSNGVALSREIAMALDLDIGDVFDWTEDETALAGIVSPLRVVGLLSGDVRLGIMSYEYLDNHERYHDLASYGLLVTAKPGQEGEVDGFLRNTVRSSRIDTYTYQLVQEEVTRNQTLLRATFLPIVLLVTAAIALVISAVNQLNLMRRLPEFGTLHAVGCSRRWLARRLTLETAVLSIAGWGLGILLSLGGMAILSALVYAPQGFGFGPLQESALLLVTPLPLVVIGSAFFTANHILGRMDAVAIVERGELSLEASESDGTRSSHARYAGTEKPSRPLAPTTFYRRHKRQAAALIGTMALMIVGTALLVFVLRASTDVMLQPPLTPLRPMSLVSPKRLPLDNTVTDQIDAHPAVERTIPVYVFSPLEIAIPPMMIDYPVEAYGVLTDDLAYMVELYGLRLEEGHLPRPNTNEIAIPWTVAQNRGIQVGDVIGDRAHPIYDEAPILPSELVVSGILKDPAKNNWLSFVSQEFINANRDSWRNDFSLVVVPRPRQKAALDMWLEDRLAGERLTVLTLGRQQAWWQEAANTLLFTITLMESVIALVAALALLGLNYVFISQRRPEFGLLNAIGLNRLQLVWRVVRETLFTTGMAWLVGLLGCASILVYLQQAVYAPVGLGLDLFNPTPWLYTLPVPVAVLAVSAAAVGWSLSRLDPIAVIERR